MRKAALIVVATLAVAAGCGTSGEQPAATVNDTVITDASVVSEMKAFAANPDLVSTVEARGTKVNGETPGTFDPTFASLVLTTQIANELVAQEVARRGLSISDDCRAKARNDTFVEYGNGTASDGEAVVDAFPAAYQDVLVQRQANLLALQNDLVHQVCGSPEAAATYYRNHPNEFASSICLSLISVADDTTATDVVNRARAGEDFASLAQQYSTDVESRAQGGDIGCFPPSQLPSTLATAVEAAQPGDVIDPLATGIGPTIFKVRTKDIAPFDQVEQQAEELADGDLVTEFRAWLTAARDTANIEVDRRYGTFDRATLSVAPPASATTTTTVAPEPTANLSP